MKLLKDKLVESNATEKRFGLLTKGLIISIVLLILTMIIALADT